MRRTATALATAILLIAAIPAAAHPGDAGPDPARNVVPIVVEIEQMWDGCDFPLPVGETCGFWYEGTGGLFTPGDVNWSFANLDTWSRSGPPEGCVNWGAAARGASIVEGYPAALDLGPEPPTFVCSNTGHATSNFDDLVSRVGDRLTVLVGVCDLHYHEGGSVPCGTEVPFAFGIGGFARLRLQAVLRGDDPEAVGTPMPATPGACGLREPDPNAICLVFRGLGPEYRPDALIGLQNPGIGDDVYGGPEGQTVEVLSDAVVRDGAAFRVRVENDGTFRDSLRIDGPLRHEGWRVRYLVNGWEVTHRVRAGTFGFRDVGPGDDRVFRVRVEGDSDPGPYLRIVVRSAEWPHLDDVVAAQVVVASP